MLGRLIGLWAHCRHLCRCCSPALPKCSTSHNWCYVLTVDLLVGLTDSHLYMYKCEHRFNYSGSSDRVNKYSELIICCDSKTLCGDIKCVRCVGDDKCPVQWKCMQNAIENRHTCIFHIKVKNYLIFSTKEILGNPCGVITSCILSSG